MTNNQASFTIKYQVPYPTAPLLEEWRTETFTSKDKAESRIRYYRECGSPASFIWLLLVSGAQFLLDCAPIRDWSVYLIGPFVRICSPYGSAGWRPGDPWAV
jgi:hypothetical protein